MSLFWRPKGCVLWFDFAELSGDTVYDLSGNGNHGTIYGAQWRKGPLIGALSFDGVDDYVEALNVIEQKPFTVELLVRLEAIDYAHLLDSRDAGFAVGGKGFCIEEGVLDGKYTVGIGDGSTAVWSGEIIDLSDNEYHHLTVTVDDLMKIYLDNNLIVTKDVTGVTGSLKAATNLKIGWGINTNWYFDGSIAYVRIYNRVLSEEEIKLHYRYLFSLAKQAVPSRFVPRALGV